MSHFYKQVSVSSSFAAHGGEDAGFVPLVWHIRLIDETDAIEYSFDGATVHGRVGPATQELPQNGEKKISGKSRIWLKSSGGGETVDVEAWD